MKKTVDQGPSRRERITRIHGKRLDDERRIFRGFKGKGNATVRIGGSGTWHADMDDTGVSSTVLPLLPSSSPETSFKLKYENDFQRPNQRLPTFHVLDSKILYSLDGKFIKNHPS